VHVFGCQEQKKCEEDDSRGDCAGAGLWTVTSVFSVIVIGRVYTKMRGGTAAARARQEAYAAGL
jgi:hypothetical protein